MEDDSAVTFIEMVPMMISLRSSKVNFYCSRPKGIPNPNFGVNKIRSLTRIGLAGMYNRDLIQRHGLVGGAAQFFESPQIMQKVLFHFDLGSLC